MKKIFLMLLFLILSIFLVKFVLAANDNANNPQSFLQTIIDKLDIITDKLTQIVNKEWNPTINVEPPVVNIEPNITIMPPMINVTVQPNITLPGKECKWENLNQKIDGFSGPVNEDIVGYKLFSDIFYVPLDKTYTNVSVINGSISADCYTTGSSSSSCLFVLNNVYCGAISRDSVRNIYPFSNNCINAIKSGTNNLTLKVPKRTVGNIYDIYIEMQIKPANC